MTTIVITNSVQGPYYETSQANVISTGNYLWRYRPQASSMSAAVFILLAGGMDLALGLGWNINTGILTTMHFQFSWFIGVIVGAILAAPFIPFLHKRVYMALSSLLMLASGIIYVSVPYDYDPIIAARYVSGIGVGLCTVAAIVHGSEIGAPACRGAVLSLEQYAISFGMAIQVIYASQWTPLIDLAANRMHGIFLIAFALIAFGSIYFIIESPIFYLRKRNDEAAMDCLRLLELPQLVTNYTKANFEELRNYVTQENNQTFMESYRKSILPLAKMLLYRSMVAFTFSIPLSVALEFSSSIGLIDSNSNWTPIVYAVLRLLAAFISIWLLDSLGRKALPLISLLCIGGLSIGYGIQYSDDSNAYDSNQMSIVVTLMLIAQFLAGLFTASSSAYLGEAFSLSLKPYCLALCVGMQQIVHIVTIVAFSFTMYNTYVYFIVIGCIMIVLSIYFFVAMPETRQTTLAEAQRRFRMFLYLKML